MTRLLLTLTVVIALTGSTATAALATGVRNGTIAIVDVTAIPMDGAPIIPDAVVVVDEGVITALGPRETVDVPAAATVVDGGGGYVIPGLVDSHFHADGEPNSLVLALAHGVTTIQNLNALVEDADLAAAVEAGDLPGPRMLNGFHAVGYPPIFAFALDRVDGSIDPWFTVSEWPDAQPFAPPAGFAKDADAARTYVARALDLGTEFFKTNLNVPRDAFDVIVEAAGERRMTVQGHISGQIGLEHFIASGAHPHHVTEVAPYLSSDARQGVPLQRYDFARVDERLPRLAQLMVDSGTWFTPTANLLWYLQANLVDLEGLRTRPQARYLTPGEREQITNPEANFVIQLFGGPDAAQTAARYLDAQGQIIRALDSAGVPLLAGTDASAAPGSVRGFDLHLELEQLVAHGLTPFEALDAATRRPAEFWDAAGQWGSLTVGARADLVVLGSNPLDDITATRDIDGVMAAGRWYPRLVLDEMLDEIAAEYESAAAAQPN